MKKSLLSNIIILFIFLLFISCTGDIHFTPSMRKAELIMDNMPDTARVLLSKDSCIIRKENKPTRIYYDMLLSLAKDKCYIPHTSDSVMLKVADYYRYHGTPRQKFMSYYLLGRVYIDMNLTADALNYFNKALDVNGVDSSFIYVARANNQIGHLYMYQDMYQRALPYFFSTYKYAMAAKDTSVMVFALRDIGRVYDELNDAKRSITYYERSVNLLEKSKLYRLKQHIYPEVATIYLKDKNYDKAELYFYKSLSSISNEEKSTIYYIGGRIFEFKNEIDKAITYYKMSVASTGMNIYSKKDAASSLNSIYTRKKMYSDACIYADSWHLYTDSICKITLSENKNLIHSLNDKLTIERKLSELRKNIIIIILISAIIIVITILIARHKLKKIKEKEALYESVKKALELKGKDYREKAESKLAELNRKIEIADKENDNLRMRLLQLELKKEEENIGRIVLDEERQQLVIEEFRETDLYRYFKNKSETDQNNFISNEKWDELEEYLNNNFDQFCKQLRHKYKVDNRNLRMCCLIKLFFTNKEIGEIFCISRSATSNMRSRLYSKLFGKNGSATDLDAFIHSFPDCVNNM